MKTSPADWSGLTRDARRLEMQLQRRIGVGQVGELEEYLEIQPIGQFLQELQVGLAVEDRFDDAVAAVVGERRPGHLRHGDVGQRVFGQLEHLPHDLPLRNLGELLAGGVVVLELAQVVLAGDGERAPAGGELEPHVGHRPADHRHPALRWRRAL